MKRLQIVDLIAEIIFQKKIDWLGNFQEKSTTLKTMPSVISRLARYHLNSTAFRLDFISTLLSRNKDPTLQKQKRE